MSVFRVIKKYNQIFTKKMKLHIIMLAMMMFVGGLLETVSVSLMIPFMNAVIEPDSMMSNDIISKICELLNVTSSNAFIILLALALALAYILKNIYLLFELNIQYKIVYGYMYQMQKNLLRILLNRPYEYFLKVSSGDVLRLITNDTVNTFALLTNLLNMFIEIFVTGMLIIALFVITPVATVLIFVVLMIVVLLINFVIKPRLKDYGEKFQVASSGINKWLIQSIQGIKEIKVMNREEFFQNNYDKYGKTYVEMVRKRSVLSVAPKYLVEGTCMGATFVAFSIIIYHGAELDSIIPTVSAIAMAAIRLLPSVSRISNGLTYISANEMMLDSVVDNLKNVNVGDASLSQSLTNDPRLDGKSVNDTLNLIIFDDVTYTYPGQEGSVLEEVSFSIKKGESIGIVGESGAGKTTAVDIILGLLHLDKGRVLVDGVDIKNDMSRWLSRIGYIPQMIFMLDDSIRANVEFGNSDDSDSEERVWYALKEAALDDFIKTLPEGLDTQIGERGVRLSGGQRQRIGIARALYKNPEILVFDEATSALDNDTEAAIMESINSLQGQKTMIIIAHRLTTIEKCDHIYRVENKKIVRER